MSSTPVRVAVFGAYGRLGRAIVDAIGEAQDLVLVGAITAHPEAHAGEGPVAAAGTLDADAHPDVIVDATAPAACVSVAEQAVKLGSALVVASTALDDADRAALARAAGRVPVVVAPNLSIGVHLLHRLVGIAASALDAHVEIVETHHAGKRDAPSGTALSLVRVVEAARGPATHRHGREGTSAPRSREEIGVHAVRGGDIAGEHQVLFLGEGERLELVHRASGRRAFATGAVRAVRFAAHAAAGHYEMADVLSVRTSNA